MKQEEKSAVVDFDTVTFLLHFTKDKIEKIASFVLRAAWRGCL